jgi:hypothetical protein
MDANQRSEVNNQTNNGANEKWTPGAKGNTTSGPMDHTYPQGASQQQGQQGGGEMGTQQSGMGPGADAGGMGGRDSGSGQALPGGSMQTQQTGGSGPQQGITDSHQRQMEQRSGAYGQLEQPVGGRPEGSGTSLTGNRQSGNTQATERMNPQDPRQPELQGGSLGGQHGNLQSGTQGGGQHGPSSRVPNQQGGAMGSQQAGASQGPQGGGQMGPGAGSQSMQRGTGMASEDRKGSQTGNDQREKGVHESNDVAGGLPRSPGNTGASSTPRTTHLTGAQNDADLQRTDIDGVHDSNDLGGGYPRSPGGANKLAADEKMDDDTGFSNPGR